MRARTRVVALATALTLGACGAEPPIVPAVPPPAAPMPEVLALAASMRDPPADAVPPKASAPCPPLPTASVRPHPRVLLPFPAAVLRFDRRFTTSTLLSTDGRTLAVWEPNRVGSDDAGIYLPSPKARLTIVDVDTDRVVDTLRLTERDALKDEASTLERLAVVERAFTARAWEEVPAYLLEPDASAPAPRDDDAPQARIAHGEGLTVQYREPTLTVTDEGGATLLRRDFQDWTMAALLPRSRCPARGVLSRVWGRRARGLVLVELRYDGRCPYGSASHIVRFRG